MYQAQPSSNATQAIGERSSARKMFQSASKLWAGLQPVKWFQIATFLYSERNAGRRCVATWLLRPEASTNTRASMRRPSCSSTAPPRRARRVAAHA